MSEVLASSSGRPTPGTTRRGFARTLVGSALGTLAMPAVLHGRNIADTLNIALVGVGGRGADNHKTVGGMGRTSLPSATWTRTTWGKPPNAVLAPERITTSARCSMSFMARSTP